MTRGGREPLVSTEENCTVIEVTEDDIMNSVKTIPKVKTLVSLLVFRRPPGITSFTPRLIVQSEFDTTEMQEHDGA